MPETRSVKRDVTYPAPLGRAHCGPQWQNALPGAGEQGSPDIVRAGARMHKAEPYATEFLSSDETCTGCEGAISRDASAVSPDGLNFCSPVCYARYPKLASSPEVTRLLRAAAAFILLLTGFVLYLLIHRFRTA